jgi:MFS family permease
MTATMEKPRISAETTVRLILAFGFLIGVALMGLQMLLSRPLAANFGSDIVVWSTLISVTMLAMMVGYYAGGRIADRAPRSEVLGVAVLAAAAYFAVMPAFLQAPILEGATFEGEGFALEGAKRSVLQVLSDTEEVSSPALGALLASMLLVFIPFALMSMFSPFCIRLLLSNAAEGGRVAGSVYAITTLGNILGTLGTTFVLMPQMPVSRIILLFAGLLALCGLGLILVRGRAHHGH